MKFGILRTMLCPSWSIWMIVFEVYQMSQALGQERASFKQTLISCVAPFSVFGIRRWNILREQDGHSGIALRSLWSISWFIVMTSSRVVLISVKAAIAFETTMPFPSEIIIKSLGMKSSARSGEISWNFAEHHKHSRYLDKNFHRKKKVYKIFPILHYGYFFFSLFLFCRWANCTN